MRNKQSPDVLIGIPRLDGLDVTNYMRNDYFLPLTQHLQNDPTFDDLQYESNILHAGAYQGTQYVLPFLFSLKVLITQEDAFTESELSMWGHYSGGEIYADLANYFTDFQPLTYETPLSALGIADEFSYATEFLSAGLDLNNPSFAATSLDERFVRYLLLYRPFLKKAAEASAGTPERELQQTCDISAYMYYPSFLSIEKLAAVQQYYDHKEQSCILIPMPNMTEGNVYPAVVELYGCVLKESPNPKAAYCLLRTLLDTASSTDLGFSVNQNVNFDALQPYLDNDFAQTITMMLHNISHAVFGQSSECESVLREAFRSLGEKATVEEAVSVLGDAIQGMYNETA